MSAGDILLDADGNRMLDFIDGALHLSDGVGDDCCCGGCPCDDNSCGNCATNETPSTFELTLADIVWCTCLDNGDGTSSSFSGDPNGTYTLTGGACVWSYTAGSAGPITGNFVLYGSATDCTGSSTNYPPDDFVITLTRGATTWTLVVQSTAVSGPFRTVTWFSKTWAATGDECCSPLSANNGNTGCGPGLASVGYNGSATLTPCPD